MSRVEYVLWGISIAAVFSLAGCGNHHQATQSGPLATNSNESALMNQSTNQSAWRYEQDRQKALAEAMAHAQKQYEEKLHHPELFTNRPPSEWPFPNYAAGPRNPVPDYTNFYSVDDQFPSYLLCEYRVNQERYNQVNEPQWFTAALKQIRQFGPKKFPPVKWVAIIIENDSEWRPGKIDQAHKVGAILKASRVFDPTCDLEQLVTHAPMSRHPFEYDTSQSTPGQQQRWLIVEQHAATNRSGLEAK